MEIIKAGFRLGRRKAGETVYFIGRLQADGRAVFVEKQIATLQIGLDTVGQIWWVLGSFSDAGMVISHIWHPHRFENRWVAYPFSGGRTRIDSITIGQFSNLNYVSTYFVWPSMGPARYWDQLTPGEARIASWRIDFATFYPDAGLTYAPDLGYYRWRYKMNATEAVYLGPQMAQLLGQLIRLVGDEDCNVASETLTITQRVFCPTPADALVIGEPSFSSNLVPDAFGGSHDQLAVANYIGENEWFS